MRSRISKMPLWCHWYRGTTARCGIQWQAAVTGAGALR